MSTTTPKNRTTRRSRPATDGPATDTAATDTAATDTAATDTAAAGTVADTAATEGTVADTAATEGTVADTAVTDGPADTDGGEVTWADAVPWLALQVGSRPSVPEVAFAVPVWRMLNAAPGSTMLRLAADAEVNGLAMDPAVITRILTRYQRAGIARAEVDGPVTRWSPITPGAIVADARRELSASAESGASTPSARSARVTGGGGSALPPGGLRQALADFLAAHPYEDWSPSQISKHLGNSSGAIANALEKLVSDGTVTLTSQRPRRFQHAGATDGADTPTGDHPADPADPGPAAGEQAADV